MFDDSHCVFIDCSGPSLAGILEHLELSKKHLGRYDSALRDILAALGRVLRAIRSPKQRRGPTAKRQQLRDTRPRGEGGEEINSLPGTGDGVLR